VQYKPAGFILVSLALSKPIVHRMRAQLLPQYVVDAPSTNSFSSPDYAIGPLCVYDNFRTKWRLPRYLAISMMFQLDLI